MTWLVRCLRHGTYFVDRLLSFGISHVSDNILARYVTFLKSLRESPSEEVSVLVHLVSRDIQTTTGNNLHLIRDLSGLDPWACTSKEVKEVLGGRLREVPEQDMWRLPYLSKLLEQRGELHHRMMDTSEVTELIDSICEN